RKSSQKHSAVRDARATRPSKNRTASRVAPRVIPIHHSLEATASRQQSLGSGRISDQKSRAAGREEQVPLPAAKPVMTQGEAASAYLAVSDKILPSDLVGPLRYLRFASTMQL